MTFINTLSRIGVDKCPICDSKGMVIPGPFGPHVGKVICTKCGRWIRWTSKKEMKDKGG